MKFKLQIAIEDKHGETCLEDVINIEKDIDNGYSSGLSLQESKNILKVLQQKIVLSQAKQYTNLHRACSCCQKQRRIKGHHSIQFKTLFGTVVIPSLRVYHCSCNDNSEKTFSLLRYWLPEHISPELQYIETKWASYMGLCGRTSKSGRFLAGAL